jgi:hypothetical protein
LLLTPSTFDTGNTPLPTSKPLHGLDLLSGISFSGTHTSVLSQTLLFFCQNWGLNSRPHAF